MPVQVSSTGQICTTMTPLQYVLAKAKAATGRRVTRKSLFYAAKHCGLQLAAASHGLTMAELCQVVAMGPPRRRARGISAADLRRTRQTLGKIKRMYESLPRGPSRAPRRRS